MLISLSETQRGDDGFHIEGAGLVPALVFFFVFFVVIASNYMSSRGVFYNADCSS